MLLGLLRHEEAAPEIAAAPAGRRDRPIDAGAELVVEALGTKLLHGWLQNRHQTLFPLSLNLARLSLPQQEAVVLLLATLLRAGRPDADTAAPSLHGWLQQIGAGPSLLDHFDAALGRPLPLNEAFDLALSLDVTTYAYVAALAASDPRFPVSVMLPDMVQARFDLPTAIVRSATRRYRR